MTRIDVHQADGPATTDELSPSNPAIGQAIDVAHLFAEHQAATAELRRLRRDNARLTADVVELRRECEQLEQDRDHWIQLFETAAEAES